MSQRTLLHWLMACMMIALVAGQPSVTTAQPHTEYDGTATSYTRELPTPHDYFTDVTLTNQYGEQKRLYSDLLKGQVVIINVFYSVFEGECPAIMRRLSKIQKTLETLSGRDVHLLTISVTPQLDTPDKLRAYADQLNACYGWEFLTGEKRNVDIALSKFGHDVENRTEHSKMIIVGNESTGLWEMVSGTASEKEILQTVRRVMQDSGSMLSSSNDMMHTGRE